MNMESVNVQRCWTSKKLYAKIGEYWKEENEKNEENENFGKTEENVNLWITNKSILQREQRRSRSGIKFKLALFFY